MRGVAALLVVFAAGVALGYMLADRDAPPAKHIEPALPEVPAESAPEPMTVAEPPPALEPAPKQQPAPKPAADTPSEPPPPPPAPKRTKPQVTKDGRVEVIVKVELPSGQPPDVGKIYWTSAPDTPHNRLRRMRWKPPQTSAFVQPGEVWLHATGGPREGFKSDRVHLTVSADGPLQEVRLVLHERAGIHGKVVLPGEFDRPSLRVQLVRYAGDVPPENPNFDRRLPYVSPSAKDGYAFAFHDLKPGGYLLALSFPVAGPVVIEDVRVLDSMVEQDLVLDAFDPQRYMEVLVLGPDGKPLRDAQITISFSGDSGGVAGGNVTLARKDGVYIIDHAPRHTTRADGSYKEGVFSLHVRSRRHGAIVRRYDPASSERLTIQIEAAHELVVKLDGYVAGAFPRSLRVGIRGVGEIGVRNPRAVGRDGLVHFGEHMPGTWEVVMLAGGAYTSMVAVHRIKFAAGDGPKEIPAPTFHRLVVRLPKDADDPEFSLSRRFGKESWSYGWARRGSSGDMVFKDLTAGTYILKGHVGTRWIKREVRIPEESVIRID